MKFKIIDEPKIHCYEMNQKNKCYARRHKQLLAQAVFRKYTKKRDKKVEGKKVYSGTEDEIVRQIVSEQNLKECDLNQAVRDISDYVGPARIPIV